MAVLQTRSAAARGPKPARASIVLEGVQATGQQFVFRSSRRPLNRAEHLLLTIVGISSHTQRALEAARLTAGRFWLPAAARNESQSDPEAYAQPQNPIRAVQKSNKTRAS